MEQKSKYEIWQERNKIRAERENNLKILENKLKRAQDLDAVIPFNYDSEEERRIVSQTINQLENMIESEKTALAELDLEPMDVSVGEFGQREV